MKIFKYPINYYNTAELVRLPKGAKVLTGGIQESSDQASVIWALVDETESEVEERVFAAMYTGWDIPGKVKEYFGTNYINSLGLVFHFVELVRGTAKPIFDPEDDKRI